MNRSSREKPFAIACERNRDPILTVLRQVLPERGRVLEVGSGTGQHAAYFSAAFPHLEWLPSDLPENLEGISLWREQAGENCLAPISLDLLADRLQLPQADAIVCINTLHIVAWQGACNLFEAAGRSLAPGQVVYLYGPYRYADRPLEPSNVQFNQWLKDRDPVSGIRNLDDLTTVARDQGFVLDADAPMPANNRSLCFRCVDDR
ncbi:MAG: hypothetical protein CL389_02810 [Acidiferrobacteraceae bacterium]|jgi:SAM-dependent methyltransferase|nr:hypothetical protein [Acidiferrobacteraceae bacterium]MDP6397893.1 DUF938 domain-containing protein [Arenicellales bacterium]MDP6550881.1 DUF938 domain-containing protein [Arenicellales bacterium]MDP6790743.1 DUF938 domain-containing protein [Arenicellales bacterium]MDP6917915.1 DUF938 domain-containing protein [Arenicellales bacterium]|tara:strand:+ start:6749 stop:7363 length:615 start_codon:yes stop_codon:yes gene_type:complete